LLIGALAAALVLAAVLGAFLVFRGNDAGSIATPDGSETGIPLFATSTPEPSATPTAEPSATPTVMPTTTAEPTPSPTAVVSSLAGGEAGPMNVTDIGAGSSLNVRSQPGSTNTLLGNLAANATGIEGTGRRSLVDGQEWREIRFNGGTGWVLGFHVIAAPAAAPTAAPTETATPEPLKELASDNPGLYNVTGINEGASLNVRRGPGATTVRLGTYRYNATGIPSTGERVLVGQTEWREVSFRDGFGWVDASFLVLAPAPVETVLLARVPRATIGVATLSPADARLLIRDEPGFDKSGQLTIGSGSVNLLTTGNRARVGQQRWTEVTIGEVDGWLLADYLITNPATLQEVLDTSGVALATISSITVDGTRVTLTIGETLTDLTNNATVSLPNGETLSPQTWVSQIDLDSEIQLELKVIDGQVSNIRTYE